MNPEEAGRKVGTVSSLSCFLHRSLDTGFSSKWAGLWSPPYKYLDYYALKVNGEWLSPETLVNAEYGDSMTFEHRTESFHVEETVEAPGDISGLKAKFKIRNDSGGRKAAHAALEAGIDIRHRSQDIGPESYDLEDLEDGFRAASGDRYLEAKGGEPEGEPRTREHWPGERQRCLVPGELVNKIELDPGEEQEIEFVFETDGEASGKISITEQTMEGFLEGGLKDCTDSMTNLIYEQDGKQGVIAGHPWFQSFWARDSFWTALGMIDAGMFDEVREMLEMFAEEGLNGRIGTEDSIQRADTAPLFVIAGKHLETVDEITSEIEEACRDAMNDLEIDEDGLVLHDPEGTWMDTLERAQAVDIQSLWLEAAELMEDSRAEELREGLEQFLRPEGIEDTVSGDSPITANAAVPLMFGQVDEERAERYLDRLNGELVSNHGARTRSATDPGYDSSGYHTGSVWGLTTGWLAAANARYGRNRRAANLLQKMSDFLDRGQPGALPEVLDAETGDLLGCPEQAWSAGLFVHVIDSYLLEIDTKDGEVSVNPAEFIDGTRRNKRVGDSLIDIQVEDGGAEILNQGEVED